MWVSCGTFIMRCRWFSGAPWLWCWFATPSSARRSMNPTKHQRADLRLRVAEPRQRSLWWWGCSSSALPPSTSHASHTLWHRLAAWWVTAGHRTLSILQRKQPCGCQPPMCVWIHWYTCSCAKAFVKDWWPHSAVRSCPKALHNLPRRHPPRWKCHK